jgi:NADH-quinone oxidoreductase subunit G
LANVLIETGHAGKANSGLLPMYAHANTQGVFDVAISDPQSAVSNADVAWLVGVGDASDAPQAAFTIVQDLFLTDLAKEADVVLPALSFAEREGTFTSGDRRIQRFYRALPPLGNAKPDWWAFQEVAKQLNINWSFWSAQQIFDAIAAEVSAYSGITYSAISQNETQWPPMGRADLYYGGTVYDNEGGIGVRYPADAERAGFNAQVVAVSAPEPTLEALNRKARMLYQAGELINRSRVLQSHVIGVNDIMEMPLAAK